MNVPSEEESSLNREQRDLITNSSSIAPPGDTYQSVTPWLYSKAIFAPNIAPSSGKSLNIETKPGWLYFIKCGSSLSSSIRSISSIDLPSS